MKYRFPLPIHISTIFLTLIPLIGGVVGGRGYQVSRETFGKFTSLIGPAEIATSLLSNNDGIAQAKSLDERLANLGFLREARANRRGGYCCLSWPSLLKRRS